MKTRDFNTCATSAFKTNLSVLKYTHGTYEGGMEREISKRAKNWLSRKGYNDVQVKYRKGVFHVTNANNYMLTAKDILEEASGIEGDKCRFHQTILTQEEK